MKNAIKYFEVYTNSATDNAKWACGKFVEKGENFAFKYNEREDRIIIIGRMKGKYRNKQEILEFLYTYSRDALKGGAYVGSGKNGCSDRATKVSSF